MVLGPFNGMEAAFRGSDGDRHRNRWGESASPEAEQLYDHRKDPSVHINLARDPAYSQHLADMRQALDAARAKARSFRETLKTAPD